MTTGAVGRAPREFDVVLLGASGFVGRLTAAHLAATAPPGSRIALAGRSLQRLGAVRADLPPAAANWPLVECDVSDARSVASLARRSRVVATAVGPYSRLGLGVVTACAHAGTHYCDLTGEVLFVRQVIDACHEVACRTGARIVPACGFDSIPSDLGVWATARAAHRDGQGDIADTTLYVRQLRGGISGGTIDSMRQQAIQARSDPAARRVLADPEALSQAANDAPSPARPRVAGSRLSRMTARLRRAVPIGRDPEGHWTGPFVMASFNTRIVRRSNALLSSAYGRPFRYRELQDFGASATAPARAALTTAGLLVVAAGMAWRPTRRLLDAALPAPGDGPPAEQRARGRFAFETVARTTTGGTYRTTVAAPLDPGYDGTAVMFGQAALTLAFEAERLPDRAGVLTPAVAMAEALTERLIAQGFTIATARD